jgi:hypothetical protein
MLVQGRDRIVEKPILAEPISKKISDRGCLAREREEQAYINMCYEATARLLPL